MTTLIILAAGRGARLSPLTDHTPKALVPVGQRPLLEWTLDHAARLGIDRVVIVAGYRAEQFMAYDADVIINKHYASTNMVETLFCAQSRFEQDCIVSYGDIVFNHEVLETLLSRSEPVSVVIDTQWRDYWRQRFDNPLDDAETLKLDQTGNITEIGQAPIAYEDIAAQYIGLMRFQGDGVQSLEQGHKQAQDDDHNQGTCFNSGRTLAQLYLTDLLQGMIDHGVTIKAVPIAGGWLEIDTVADYQLAQQYVEQGWVHRAPKTEEY